MVDWIPAYSLPATAAWREAHVCLWRIVMGELEYYSCKNQKAWKPMALYILHSEQADWRWYFWIGSVIPRCQGTNWASLVLSQPSPYSLQDGCCGSRRHVLNTTTSRGRNWEWAWRWPGQQVGCLHKPPFLLGRKITSRVDLLSILLIRECYKSTH